MPEYETRLSMLEVEELEAENRALRAQLNDANEYKSEIMALHGEDSGPTDISIQDDFLKLCKNIDNWVDTYEREESEHYFRHRFLEVWVDSDESCLLYDLGLLLRRDDTASMRGHLMWLVKQDTCKVLVVSLTIWKYLLKYILEINRPIGATIEEADLLNEIYEEMVKKETNKGIQSGTPTARFLSGGFVDTYEKKIVSGKWVMKWRGATMGALIETSRYKLNLKDRADELFRNLLFELKDWVSPDMIRRSQSKLRSDIFDSAVALNQSICCSQRSLFFDKPKVPLYQGDKSRPTEARLWTLKNFVTWMPTKYDEIIGTLCCLIPGLSVQGMDQPLVKPVVIALKDEPTPECGNDSPTTRPSTTRHPKKPRRQDSGNSTSSTLSDRMKRVPGLSRIVRQRSPDKHDLISRHSDGLRRHFSNTSSPKRSEGVNTSDSGGNEHGRSRPRRNSISTSTGNHGISSRTPPLPVISSSSPDRGVGLQISSTFPGSGMGTQQRHPGRLSPRPHDQTWYRRSSRTGDIGSPRSPISEDTAPPSRREAERRKNSRAGHAGPSESRHETRGQVDDTARAPSGHDGSWDQPKTGGPARDPTVMHQEASLYDHE